jgi:hypothetical protein
MVSRTLIRPPESRLGALTPDERAETIAASPLAGRYETPVDRDSAHEILFARSEKAAQEAAMAEEMLKQAAAHDAELKQARRYQPPPSRGRAQPSLGTEITRTVIKQLGTRHGQQMIRGIFGSLFRGR